MTPTRCSIALAVCLLLFASPTLADEIRRDGPAAMLALRYVPGTTYVQTMKLDQSATMPMAGAGSEQKTEMTMVSTMKAGAGEGKGVTLEMGIDRVEMSMAMMGQTMRYDSADESTHEGPLAMMGAMIGPKLTLSLDADNNLTDVDGVDTLVAGMTEGNAMSSQLATQMFGDEQVRRMADFGMSHVLPRREVSPGDEWTSTFKVPAGGMGEMEIRSTNTFAGYAACGDARCAVIDSAGSFELDLEGGDDAENADVAAAIDAMRAMGVEFERAEITGRVFFDPKLGMLREGRSSVEMTMSMQLPNQGERAEIAMKQDSTVTVTVAK